MVSEKAALFVNFEAEEDQVLIEAFIDNIYDNGQYCEQMGTFLGFISCTPCQIQFINNICNVVNLYEEEFDPMLQEITTRLLRLFEGKFDFEIMVADFNSCCLEIKAYRIS